MIETSTPLGPSVKRLLIEFLAKREIDDAKTKAEPGEFGLVAAIAAGLAEGNGSKLKANARGALDDVNAALLAVRSAAEPNPFKSSTDEEIASAILERLKGKRETLTKSVLQQGAKSNQ